MKKFLALFGKFGASMGFLLVLATLSIVVVATLNKKSPLSVAAITTTTEVTPSPVSQKAAASPTATLIPPDVTVDWIPTPIKTENLPTPLPGTGHITGRAMCGSVPNKLQFVYLIWIEGDTYSILQSVLTDEEGRWFFGDVHPATYAILGEPPKSMPREVFVVTPDKLNDLGDISLPPEVCE